MIPFDIPKFIGKDSFDLDWTRIGNTWTSFCSWNSHPKTRFSHKTQETWAPLFAKKHLVSFGKVFSQNKKSPYPEYQKKPGYSYSKPAARVSSSTTLPKLNPISNIIKRFRKIFLREERPKSLSDEFACAILSTKAILIYRKDANLHLAQVKPMIWSRYSWFEINLQEYETCSPTVVLSTFQWQVE